MIVIRHRSFVSGLRRHLLFSLSLRSMSNTIDDSPTSLSPQPLPTENPPYINPEFRPRSRTPSEIQFETWINNLGPGFTPEDVEKALLAQSDPDLALDIFRWTGQRRGYKHNAGTYLTMIRIAVSGRRHGVAETLVEEVIAGACHPSLLLYNSMIKFCCNRKFLFNRAFDIYKKMLKCDDAKPNLETYTMLLISLLKKFRKLHVSHMYLPAVRSLTKQMKASGVIPNTFVLNMIIKAYSRCLEVDEAIRISHEMGLYNCTPDDYTYSYIIRGLCEKSKVHQGMGFYRDMREKGLVPRAGTFMILVCSLSLERRFEEARDVMLDMLHNSMSPDLLTYKTLLEGLCRDGRGNDAFEILEEFKGRDRSMNENMYKTLLNELHFQDQE